MATIPKAILDLLTNSKTAKFAESLKHSDLPTGWADDPEIVDLAAKAWQEAGTDSPFFKAWFGNSKVVDDSGKPLQVYHGTNAYDLKKFKPGKSGLLGGGIYTTPNEKLALRYTDYPDTGIYSLYEKMENPFRITDMDAASTILGEIYGSKAEKELAKRIDKQGNAAQIITKKDAKKIQDKGYDGIFWDVLAGKEYSTLDPTAIKSVNNRGTFNPNEPNIYRSLAPVGVGTAALAASLLAGGDEAKAAAINAALADPASREKAAAAGLPYDPPVEESAWSPADLLVAPVGAVGIPAKLLAMALDAPVTLGLDAGLSALGELFGGGDRKKPGGW